MSLRRVISCTLPFVGLALVSLQAADDNRVIFPGGSGATQTGGTNAPGSTSLNSLTLLLGLALAGVGGWLFWRNRRRITSPAGGQSLAINETRSLGNRQFLVVASYEGKKFLLGVCPGRIDMLAPLDGSATFPEKRP